MTQIKGHKREIVQLKSLGNKLVSADSQLIKIYDLEKGQNVNGIFFKESSNVSSIDFFSQTSNVLAIGDSNAVKIYDLRMAFNNSPLMEITLVDQVNKVAASGEFIGSIGDEGIIEIIDTRNPKQLVVFKKINRHGNIGSALEFRNKRKWQIVSGGYDSRVFLSDFSNAHIIKEFPQGQEEIGINAPFVTALKFKENGDKLGIGRFNGIIQLHESKRASRKNEIWEMKEVRGHRYAVMDLEFSNDFMASTGLDGALSLWDLSSDLPVKRESVEFEGYKFNSLTVLKTGALDTGVKVAIGGFTLKDDPKIFIHDFRI